VAVPRAKSRRGVNETVPKMRRPMTMDPSIGAPVNRGWRAIMAAITTEVMPNESSSPAAATYPRDARRHSRPPTISIAGTPSVRSAIHTPRASGSIGAPPASAVATAPPASWPTVRRAKPTRTPPTSLGRTAPASRC
jgi:hypothetical protein